MKGRKNDFSMTFYHYDNKVMFLEYVHNTEKAIEWMKQKNIRWTHARIYERRTRKFLETIKNLYV